MQSSQDHLAGTPLGAFLNNGFLATETPQVRHSGIQKAAPTKNPAIPANK